MKYFIMAVALLLSVPAFAQEELDVNNIQFTIDTISYDGMKAPRRRTSDEEIEKYMASGGRNFDIANPIRLLERDLSDAWIYLQKGQRKIPWIPHMHDQVKNIKRAYSRFKIPEYEAEIKIYEAYNKNIENRKQAQYANIDSVREAKKRLEELQKLAEEARLRELQKAKTQNQDSIKAAFAKMMAIAAENEAKASKADNIKRFGDYYGQLISQGQVKQGMTKEMVEASLGQPVRIIVSEDKGEEQWIYHSHKLILKNGILFSVDGKE